MHLGETLVIAVQDGAVHVVKRLGERVNGGAGCRRGGLGHTYVGNLRFGVGTPGNRQRRRLLAALEQRIGDHDSGHEIGGVCELET